MNEPEKISLLTPPGPALLCLANKDWGLVQLWSAKTQPPFILQFFHPLGSYPASLDCLPDEGESVKGHVGGDRPGRLSLTAAVMPLAMVLYHMVSTNCVGH